MNLFPILLVAAESSGGVPLLPAIIALLVGVFGGGSLAALLRVKEDKSQVVVSAAQGAVIVQSGVIDDLQDEITRLKAEIEDLKKQRIAERKLVNQLKDENRAMRTRIKTLENGTHLEEK